MVDDPTGKGDSIDKKETLQRLLEQGTAQIILDPRRPEVHVPPAYTDTPLLRLNVSYRFESSDLKVDWWGVRQTLTFPAGRCLCRIPWEAIFAMANPRHPEYVAFWSGSVPEELRELSAAMPSTVQDQSRGATPSPRAKAARREPGPDRSSAPHPPRPRPRLRVVQERPPASSETGGAPSAPGGEDPDGPPPPGPRGRPNLRLVK